MGLLAGSMVVGVIRILAGQANTAGAIFNMVWVAFDLLIFSVIIKAARYRGFEPAAQAEPVPQGVS
jgi:cellulose synthase (UDP-forming)